MKSLLTLLALIGIAQTALAGESSVLQVSKSGKLIAITKEYASQWKPKEKLSVVREGRQIAVGTVLKVEPKRVLASVESYEERVTKGDEIAREYLEVAEPSSGRPKVRWGIYTSFGVGTAGQTTQVSGFSVSTVVGSFNVGLNAEIPIAKANWYFQPELIYSSRSFTSVNAAGQALSANSSKFTFIDTFLPIKGRIETGAGPFLAIGPYLGYLMSSPAGASEDQFNKIGFGLGIGTGLDIRLGKNFSLLVSLRYVKGLTSVSNATDFKETRFDFLTGLNFPL